MKPCSKNRKLIAWLALDALDARRAAVLREHLALCEGCRRYWGEISTVTEKLATAKPESNLEASEFFLHRVAEKLKPIESNSILNYLTVWRRGWNLSPRLALTVIAVLVTALLAVLAPRPHSALHQPTPLAVEVVSASSSESDLAPTIANYQITAIQSLEKFDELLTRQGNKPLPPVPFSTTTTLNLANASF